MNADEIVMALRKTQEDYKNDFVSTGRISISDMARDCADCIESLQAQLSKSHARERAAVADLTEILSKNELNICTFCKRYHKDCGCYMDDDTCDAVWRSPQEGEQGDIRC